MVQLRNSSVITFNWCAPADSPKTKENFKENYSYLVNFHVAKCWWLWLYFACRVYLRKNINEEKSETTKLNQ